MKQKEQEFKITYEKVPNMKKRKYRRTLFMGTIKPIGLYSNFTEEKTLLESLYDVNVFPVLVIYENTIGNREFYEFLKERV